ncbi:hypothetical protein ENSA7_41120 [Enhygromyxa salina]|uniref:Uncharacterized protein n=2 Tax=Enhygromyxa salina TaxID=215803 RepID=A0A2S9YM68_9BACT|nr:hypothetical protein ENSA7_41120 [Enhygromyxa salina]
MLLTAAFMLAPAIGGCSQQKYDVDTRPPATAGHAEIVLTADKTGNGQLSMELEHLPPPQQIDPSLQYYVVWATADGRDPYKLGVLDYDAKDRTGKLDATFSDDRLTLIVTLEKDATVSAPLGARVLEQVVIAPRR